MADVFEGLYPKVVITPLALTAILDAHTRKGERDCLCALVGTLSDDGSLFVADVIVNFEEKGMPQRQHHESFIVARQRVNPRELLLGWATTTAGGKSLNMAKLHDIAAWARSETKSSRFIPQRRFPAPVSITVDPPTPTSDLAVRCEVRGPNAAIKNVPVEFVPCFLSDFVIEPSKLGALPNIDEVQADGDDAASGVARCILERLDKVLKIAQDAKAHKNEQVGRRLLNLVNLPGLNVEEFLEVDREEAALFDWIKNNALLQLQLHAKRQTLNA